MGLDREYICDACKCHENSRLLIKPNKGMNDSIYFQIQNAYKDLSSTVFISDNDIRDMISGLQEHLMNKLLTKGKNNE